MTCHICSNLFTLTRTILSLTHYTSLHLPCDFPCLLTHYISLRDILIDLSVERTTIDLLINLSFLRHFGKTFFLELLYPNSFVCSYPSPACLCYTMTGQFPLHFLHLHKDNSWDISGLLVKKVLAQQSLPFQTLFSHFFFVSKLKICTIRDCYNQRFSYPIS